jgi:hypothetical protein
MQKAAELAELQSNRLDRFDTWVRETREVERRRHEESMARLTALSGKWGRSPITPF